MTRLIRWLWSSLKVRANRTCCRALDIGAVTTCFNDLGLSRLGFEHPTFRLRDQRSNPLRQRRGQYNVTFVLTYTDITLSHMPFLQILVRQWWSIGAFDTARSIFPNSLTWSSSKKWLSCLYRPSLATPNSCTLRCVRKYNGPSCRAWWEIARAWAKSNV